MTINKEARTIKSLTFTTGYNFTIQNPNIYFRISQEYEFEGASKTKIFVKYKVNSNKMWNLEELTKLSALLLLHGFVMTESMTDTIEMFVQQAFITWALVDLWWGGQELVWDALWLYSTQMPSIMRLSVFTNQKHFCQSLNNRNNNSRNYCIQIFSILSTKTVYKVQKVCIN